MKNSPEGVDFWLATSQMQDDENVLEGLVRLCQVHRWGGRLHAPFLLVPFFTGDWTRQNISRVDVTLTRHSGLF